MSEQCLFSWELINTLKFHNQWSHQGYFQFIKKIFQYLFYIYPLNDKMTLFKWEVYDFSNRRLIASGCSKNHRLANISATNRYNDLIRTKNAETK